MEDIIELEYKQPKINLKPRLNAYIQAEDMLKRLYTNYVDNIAAYILEEKIHDPYTGLEHYPDEKFMRSIEDKMHIHEAMVDDYRRHIMAKIGIKAYNGEAHSWHDDPRLAEALLDKLTEDVTR